MKIKINGTEKEFEVSKIYTRKMDREFNEMCFQWMKVTPAQLTSGNFEVDIANLQKANDYLIMQMTWLTQDELDGMSSEDYNKVLQEVEKMKIPSKE